MRTVAAAFFLGALTASAANGPSGRTAVRIGLEAELPPGAPEAERERAAAEVRGSGVSLFAVPVSWSECEPAPGKFRLDAVLRSVRILRQSGGTVHLDLSLVASRARDVPKDLESTAFDDPHLSLRLGRFLDALEPALRDASTISLGYAADTYFVDKPDELKAFRLLFLGAIDFLKKKTPGLQVGVTTFAPTESPSPAVAAALHQLSPVLFYVYSPFERDKPYVHRPPEALDKDWKQLLDGAAGRPIAFPQVSYSSAAENGSSPLLQAEFIRRLRRFADAADGRALLFVRYSTWRDPPPVPTPTPAPGVPPPGPVGRARASFFEHRGLQTSKGEPKPAWREWRRNPG